jgi:hypothetical protein
VSKTVSSRRINRDELTEAFLADRSKQAQERADANFKKKQTQASEGAKAWADYEADAVATRKKTERLRALRLAREAADQGAPAPEPAPKKKAGKKAAKSPPLSDWLTARRGEGRSS